VGALVRPLGGWMADKLGGARVTLWNFVAMVAVGLLVVLQFLPGRRCGRWQLHRLPGRASCCCLPPPASATAAPSA
jgi:nitrate/nitrite transporter NarK